MFSVKNIILIFTLSVIIGCITYHEAKFDSRNKEIIYSIGIRDTIYFTKNEALLDTFSIEAIYNMSQYLKTNELLVNVSIYLLYDEEISLANKRIEAVKNSFLINGINNDRLFINRKPIIISEVISEDTITHNEEILPQIRFQIMK